MANKKKKKKSNNSQNNRKNNSQTQNKNKNNNYNKQKQVKAKEENLKDKKQQIKEEFVEELEKEQIVEEIKKENKVKEEKQVQEVEAKEEVKLNKSTIFGSIITIIVSFTIVGVIFFYVYDNFIKIKEPNDNIQLKNLDQKDITKLGEDKFYWLRDKTKVENHKLLFFTDNNVLDVTNINNSEVLAVAYSQIDSDNKNATGESNGNCMSFEPYPDNCYKETFDKNVLKEQIDKYFSNKLNVNYTSFLPSPSKLCTLNNNNYECILKSSEFKLDPLYVLTSFYEAKLEDNNLVVYTGLISVKRDNDGVAESEKGVYSDVLGTNKIDNLTYFNEVTKEGYDNEKTRQLLNYYKDRATKYKTTFELINNNYVWLKTEII